MDEGGGGPTHGHLAGFSPRKSSYLRISPTLVLQLILYLEPHHVEWMNVGVFERILIALRERIPLKLEQEDLNNNTSRRQGGGGGGGGKPKDKVDVFRGTDYQMAFFFRKTNDKHVVLLKEKHLHYVTKSVVTRRYENENPPLASASNASPRRDSPPRHDHDSPHNTLPEEEEREQDALGMMGPPPTKRKRTSVLPRGSLPPTHTNDDDDDDDQVGHVPPPSRREEVIEPRASEQDDLIISIKPEPIEDVDQVMSFNQGRGGETVEEGEDAEGEVTGIRNRNEENQERLFRDEQEEEDTETFAPPPPVEEEEMKEELDQDIKPQLKVNYQKFEIFNRSLVVIVEPYPPLPSSELSTLKSRTLMNSTTTRSTSEIRQLSASVQPQPQSRRSESVYSRAGTLSVTPVPTSSSSSRRGGAAPLFRSRSDTTPLEGEEEEGTPPRVEEEDEQMRSLREMSEVFRSEGFEGADDDDDNDDNDDDDDDDDDDDLQSLDQVLEKEEQRRKRNNKKQKQK